MSRNRNSRNPKMRTITLFLGIFLFSYSLVFGQVKIGDNPQTINPAAVLELESTTMALIITRVTTLQMQAIMPSQGALVYNTDTACVHYYNGTEWINLCTSATASINVTTDPIVNQASTIVITQTSDANNIEIAPESIRSEQILDGGIFGVDINDNSIGPDKLANNSVSKIKISENAVGPFAIDRDSLPLSFFENDVPFLTSGDIVSVSTDQDNSITTGSDGGAFYNQQPLLSEVSTNADDISFIIANDLDTSPENELQNLSLTDNLLTLTDPVNGDNIIDLESFAGGGGNPTDELQDLNFDVATNILTLTTPASAGNQVDLSPLAGGSTGSDNISFEITTDSLQITDAAGTLGVSLSGLGSGGTTQTAEEVPFSPYLTLEAIDTQAAVEELKDEVDALSISGGGTNIDFLVANDSLEIVDAAGSLKIPLTDLTIPGTDQTAVEEEFTPYLTIEAVNTQAAVEELKDEVDALAVAGGGNNLDFSIVNDSIQITDAAGALGIPLTDLGGNNVAFEIANDSLSISDLGGILSVPLEGLGNNTTFEVLADSLQITDVTGTLSVALSDIAPNGINIDFNIVNDSIQITDAAGTLGIPLTNLGGNNLGFEIANDSLSISDLGGTLSVPLEGLGNNTSFEVVTDSLQITDVTGTLSVALSDIAPNGNNIDVFVANDSLLVADAGGNLGVPLADILGNSGLNTSFEVMNDSIQISDSNQTLGFPISQLGVEAITATNEGLGGEGLFIQKTAENLEFKNLNAGSNKISIVNDVGNNEIDIDINEANLIVPASQITYDPLLTGDLPNTITNAQDAIDALAADGDTNSSNEIQDVVSADGTITVTRTGDDYDLSVSGVVPGAFTTNIRTDENNLIAEIQQNDYTVILDIATNVDLPSAAGNEGRIIIIKNNTDPGNPITTSTAYITNNQNTSSLILGTVQLQSDGTVWHQIN